MKLLIFILILVLAKTATADAVWCKNLNGYDYNLTDLESYSFVVLDHGYLVIQYKEKGEEGSREMIVKDDSFQCSAYRSGGVL